MKFYMVCRLPMSKHDDEISLRYMLDYAREMAFEIDLPPLIDQLEAILREAR